MYLADFCVWLRGQEAEDVRSDLTFLRLPHAFPGGPDPGEGQERPAFVDRKPDRHLLAVDRVLFRKRRERHQATVFRAEPSLPVLARSVANIGHSAVRLE